MTALCEAPAADALCALDAERAAGGVSAGCGGAALYAPRELMPRESSAARACSPLCSAHTSVALPPLRAGGRWNLWATLQRLTCTDADEPAAQQAAAASPAEGQGSTAGACKRRASGLGDGDSGLHRLGTNDLRRGARRALRRTTRGGKAGEDHTI